MKFDMSNELAYISPEVAERMDAAFMEQYYANPLSLRTSSDKNKLVRKLAKQEGLSLARVHLHIREAESRLESLMNISRRMELGGVLDTLLARVREGMDNGEMPAIQLQWARVAADLVKKTGASAGIANTEESQVDSKTSVVVLDKMRQQAAEGDTDFKKLHLRTERDNTAQIVGRKFHTGTDKL